MELTHADVMQLLGQKELDIAALKKRIADLEAELRRREESEK